MTTHGFFLALLALAIGPAQAGVPSATAGSPSSDPTRVWFPAAPSICEGGHGRVGVRNGDDVYLVELDGGGVRHIRTRASRRVRAACRSRSGPLYAWVDIEAMGTGADRVVGLGLTDEADEMYGLEVDAEAAARLLLEIGAGDPEGRGLFAATLSPSTTAARLAAVASAEGGAEAARREAAFVLSWRYRDAAAAPLEQMARGAHLPRRLREEAIVGLALTACGQHALRSLRAEGEPWVREFATAALALHHLRRWSGDLVVRSD